MDPFMTLRPLLTMVNKPKKIKVTDLTPDPVHYRYMGHFGLVEKPTQL